MEYLDLVKNVKICKVTMNDGTIIDCARVPLENIAVIDSIIPGVQNSISAISGSLESVAKYGKTPLFTAIGDSTKYMRSNTGAVLSSVKNTSGKIAGQPGFKEISSLTKEGMKLGKAIGEVIPYVAIAVMAIDVGLKVVMHKEQIRAEEIAEYKKYQKENEHHLNNLWNVVKDYTLSMNNHDWCSANIKTINEAFNYADNSFIDLEKMAKGKKSIKKELVFSMKKALDVYSFAYLLKIMHVIEINKYKGYVDNAYQSINEKTKIFNTIYAKCYQEQQIKNKNHNKALSATQLRHKTGKDIAIRATADVIFAGIPELISLGSKGVGKKVKKSDKEIMECLVQCKESGNPFLECIRNTQMVMERPNLVLRDDKYLYYQAS